MGILEAKVPLAKIEKTLKKFIKDWDWFYNDCNNRSRIILLWRKRSMAISLMSINQQSITVEATYLLDNKRFLLTFLYGDNLEDRRNRLWKHLESAPHSIPWLILGDFNATLHIDERKGKRSVNRVEEGLKSCCRKLGLSDMSFTRCYSHGSIEEKGEMQSKPNLTEL